MMIEISSVVMSATLLTYSFKATESAPLYGDRSYRIMFRVM